MTIYGYARCSTNDTKQDYAYQVKQLKEMGASDETIYKEYQSGTKVDRVELNKLLNVIKAGDTIVATEVSRISRSTKQLCEIIDLVQEKHLKLVIGGFIVDCTKGELDPMTEGMLKMMGVFAEMERNIISQRVKAGLAASDKPKGRPKTTNDDIPAIFYKHYPKYVNKEVNASEFARLCGMSRPTIYKYIKLVEGK